MFIDHRQKQWPDWLGTVEFAYNNKAHLLEKPQKEKSFPSIRTLNPKPQDIQ